MESTAECVSYVCLKYQFAEVIILSEYDSATPFVNAADYLLKISAVARLEVHLALGRLESMMLK